MVKVWVRPTKSNITYVGFYLLQTELKDYKDTNIYRINANGIRPFEHSIYCWVQLQNFIFCQCFKPEQDENTDQYCDLNYCITYSSSWVITNDTYDQLPPNRLSNMGLTLQPEPNTLSDLEKQSL